MQQSNTVNRRIVLASRPRGQPTPQNFRLIEAAVPTPSRGQVLLRTLYLSLDPYMRQVMNEVGPKYAPSVQLEEPMVGATVNRIVTSKHPEFRVGDLVLGNAGWQDYAVSDGTDLVPLGKMAQPSQALGILGMPAFTAYVGLLDIGRPEQGETMVVAAATGAVGAVVGQIAKLKGARVVGIAGSPEKCRYAVETLGFDVCLDRRESHLAARLAAVCPEGIDVYFENVGGEVLVAVLPLLNIGARVPVCGAIAHYNEETSAPGPNRLPQLMIDFVQKRLRMQGFVILDHYADRFDAFKRDMGDWAAAGQVRLREDVIDGLERAPAALVGLLEGRNFGKLVVRVGFE